MLPNDIGSSLCSALGGPLFLLSAVFNSFLLLHCIHIHCVTVSSELLYAPFQSIHAKFPKAFLFSSLPSGSRSASSHCRHAVVHLALHPFCTFNVTRLFNIVVGRESEFHQIHLSLVLMTNEVKPIVVCLFSILVILLIVSSLKHLSSPTHHELYPLNVGVLSTLYIWFKCV